MEIEETELCGIRMYKIWSEGFEKVGIKSRATFWGTATGRSFREACIDLASRHPNFAQLFNPELMTWMECDLFDNEEDARKKFG